MHALPLTVQGNWYTNTTSGKNGCLLRNELSDASSGDGCKVGVLITLGVFFWADEIRALELTGRYLCVLACADAVVYQGRVDVKFRRSIISVRNSVVF